MDIPTTNDFLLEFGIEPVEVDPTLGLSRYIFTSLSDGLQLDISFSLIMRSFQVILKDKNGKNLVVVSSEKLLSIRLIREGLLAKINVVFDLKGLNSELCVTVEPELSFHWWLIENN